MVIVILSIVATVSTRFILTGTQSYTDSIERSKLATSGRLAAERVTRELRNALPNSIRVSTTGNCVEFMPIIASTSTKGEVNLDPNQITTASFAFNSTSDNYAVIAALITTELYQNPLPIDGVIARTSLSGSFSSVTTVPLASGHTFSRISTAERLYIVASPARFCITSMGQLQRYSSYGIIASAPIDTAPSGASSELITENIEVIDIPFIYTGASLVRNATLDVTLNMRRSGEAIDIQHSVQIRNVP